jgi:hypothetical protein
MKITVIDRKELEETDPRFRQLPKNITGVFRAEKEVGGIKKVAILPASQRILKEAKHESSTRAYVEYLAEEAFKAGEEEREE